MVVLSRTKSQDLIYLLVTQDWTMWHGCEELCLRFLHRPRFDIIHDDKIGDFQLLTSSEPTVKEFQECTILFLNLVQEKARAGTWGPKKRALRLGRNQTFQSPKWQRQRKSCLGKLTAIKIGHDFCDPSTACLGSLIDDAPGRNKHQRQAIQEVEKICHEKIGMLYEIPTSSLINLNPPCTW